MSKPSTKELVSAPAEKVFQTIMDFESYAEFLPEVKECRVLQKTDQFIDVEMQVNFIKEAKYSIRVYSELGKRIWWELIEGDFFKKNSGEWLLEEIGSQTQLTYSLDVEFKIFVPGFVLKKAVAVSLPAMVKNMKRRVESL